MYTNMLDKILKENREVQHIINKMLRERFISKKDTIIVVDCINHICEEIYDEEYFLDGTRKFHRVDADTVVFTNCEKSFEKLADELESYHSIFYDGWAYDCSCVSTVSGEVAQLYFNGLYDDGDIIKNIPFIVKNSSWTEEQLLSLTKGELLDVFWDTYNRNF